MQTALCAGLIHSPDPIFTFARLTKLSLFVNKLYHCLVILLWVWQFFRQNVLYHLRKLYISVKFKCLPFILQMARSQRWCVSHFGRRPSRCPSRYPSSCLGTQTLNKKTPIQLHFVFHEEWVDKIILCVFYYFYHQSATRKQWIFLLFLPLLVPIK